MDPFPDGTNGEEIASVGWRGDDYADGPASKNPYYKNPVLWTVR